MCSIDNLVYFMGLILQISFSLLRMVVPWGNLIHRSNCLVIIVYDNYQFFMVAKSKCNNLSRQTPKVLPTHKPGTTNGNLDLKIKITPYLSEKDICVRAVSLFLFSSLQHYHWLWQQSVFFLQSCAQSSAILCKQLSRHPEGVISQPVDRSKCI